MNNKTAAFFFRFHEKQGRLCPIACTYFFQSQTLLAFWCRVDTGLLFSKPLAVRKCQAENALCLQGKKSLRCLSGAVSLQAYSQHGKEMNPDSWVFLAFQPHENATDEPQRMRWNGENNILGSYMNIPFQAPFSLFLHSLG